MSDFIPNIDILVAVYNGENYIEKQIESLINQTYENITIYICDDNSSDNSYTILQKLQSKYSNIKLYKNDVNAGFLKNFEKLLTLSTAEFIALSDQDDIWNKNKLEIQMKAMLKLSKEHKKEKPILVHSDLTLIDASDNLIYPSFFKLKKYNLSKTKDVGRILGPCGVMGNTILMNKALKDIILPIPNDIGFHDYYIAAINEILGIRYTIQNQLVNYRIHNANVSNNIQKIKKQNSILNFKLPYHEKFRLAVIDNLLNRNIKSHKISLLLLKYKKYLENSEFTIFDVYFLIKNHICKNNLIYKINLIRKYLMYKFKKFKNIV